MDFGHHKKKSENKSCEFVFNITKHIELYYYIGFSFSHIQTSLAIVFKICILL